MKKYLICMLILLVLVSTIIVPGVVYADSPTTSVTIATSTVLDDLEATTIGGKQFNIDDYPLDQKKDLDIITLAEVCYSERPEVNQYYGLYVYIYNPKATKFNVDSLSNTIQMSIYDDGYEKLAVKHIDHTDDHRFYKFSIELIDGFVKLLKSEKRIYKVSGIELVDQDTNSITDYKIARHYEYTGFGAKCGESDESLASLQCTTRVFNTITLDVKNLEYKSQASEQNHLHSVCFNIPNTVLASYGDLSKVECQWYEYQTAPIIVTWNKPNGLSGQDYYDSLLPYVGKTTDGSALCFGTSYSATDSQLNPQIKFDWAYNAGKLPNITANTNINKIYYLFDSGSVDPVDYDLSAKILTDYIYSYDKSYDTGTINLKNGISQDLFTKTVSKGRTRGYNHKIIDTNDKADLFTDTKDSWWNKLWGTHNEVFSSVKPIEKVSLGTNTPEEIQAKYKIDAKSYDKLVASKNEAIKSNASTYIMRVGVTDYDSKVLHTSGGGRMGYMAQESVLLDFDIITLTFAKDGEETIIPAVSDPIDIIGEITHPELPPGLDDIGNALGEGIAEMIKRIVSIILIALGIILLLILLPLIVKLIALIVNSISGAIENAKSSKKQGSKTSSAEKTASKVSKGPSTKKSKTSKKDAEIARKMYKLDDQKKSKK